MPKYQLFNGKNTEQMPLLLIEGQNPLLLLDCMKWKLEALTNEDMSTQEKETRLNTYVDLGEGIAYHPSGNLKIVFGTPALWSFITPKSKLSERALVLTEKEYGELSGVELSRKEAKKYTEKWLTQEQVRNNKLWKILTHNPNEVPKEFAEESSLLEEYTDRIFSEAKKRYTYNENMGIFFLGSVQEQPTLRLWFVGGLDCRSGVSGIGGLLSRHGCFVGYTEGAMQKNNENK